MQFRTFASLLLILPILSGAARGGVSEAVWGELPDGREVRTFTLTNASGTRAVLAEYGALLVSVETADQQGRISPVTLSYRSLAEALAGGVFGSVIGRFANRISGGGFSIDGLRHDLESVNREGIHIHGGATGFQRQLWKGRADSGDDPSVTFSLTSPDGHEGYPGRVEVEVTYTLTPDHVLRLDYRGTTDAPTPLNLTNHVYFNLAGGGDVREHLLELESHEVLESDERKIPTGRLLPVAGGVFDFTTAKPIGRDLDGVPGGGYDHCFVIPGESGALKRVGRLVDPASGRSLEIHTTSPGVQIFTANSFQDNPHPRWGGICFETQHYPDTPNRPEFPTCILRPGDLYEQRTEFRFGVEPSP